MDSDGAMKTIPLSFFGVTDENELFLHWRNGKRWLSVYFNPPEDEDCPMDCFGSDGIGHFTDFESVWEGYRWLTSPAVGARKE